MKHRFILILSLITLIGLSAQDYSTGLDPVPEKLQQSFPQAQPNGLVTQENSMPGNGKQTEQLPSAVDHSQWLPPIKSQRQIGSCSAWSSIYYAKSLQENMERNWGADSEAHQFSPLYTYNQITNGVNKGTPIISHMNLVVEQGVPTWDNFPYPYDLNARPDSRTERNAALYKAESARSLTHYDRQTGEESVDFQEIKMILAGGNVVVGGFDVHESFQKYRSGIYRNASGSMVGGHAMCIVGYDDSKGAFRLVNSWGDDWGEDGFMWMDYRMAERSLNWGCAVMVDIQDTLRNTPIAPTGVESSQGAETDHIRINWNAVAGASGYVIYRADNSSNELMEHSRVRTTSFEDSNLPPGVVYLYTVASIVGGEVSEYSELVEGWTAEEAAPPGKPTELTDYFDGESLLLDWADLSTAYGYRVYRWDVDREEFRLLGTTRDSSLVDTTVPELFGTVQETYYLVVGVNREGEGPSTDSYRVSFIAPRERNRAMERLAASTAPDDTLNPRDEAFKGSFHRTQFFDYEYTMAQFRAYQEAEREAFRNWRTAQNDAFEEWKRRNSPR